MKVCKILTLLMVMAGLTACGGDTTSGSGSADGQAGSTSRFAIQQGYLNVLDNTYIKNYRLDPDDGSPELHQVYYLNRTVETIYPHGEDELFFGTTTGTLVVTINTAGRLEEKAFVDHARSCDPVVADDSAMYITLRNGGSSNCGGSDYDNHLLVYKIHNLYAPLLMDSIELDQPRGLALSGDYLLVCHANGLEVFDVSTRLAPVKLQNFPELICNDVIVQGNNLYLTSDEGIRLLASDGVELWLESEILIGQ